MGDSSSAAGYASEGELRINNHSVTLLDSNRAALGFLTTLGTGAEEGTLTAPQGLLLGPGKTLAGSGTINTPNGEFLNQGFVQGDGLSFQHE